MWTNETNPELFATLFPSFNVEIVRDSDNTISKWFEVKISSVNYSFSVTLSNVQDKKFCRCFIDRHWYSGEMKKYGPIAASLYECGRNAKNVEKMPNRINISTATPAAAEKLLYKWFEWLSVEAAMFTDSVKAEAAKQNKNASNVEKFRAALSGKIQYDRVDSVSGAGYIVAGNCEIKFHEFGSIDVDTYGSSKLTTDQKIKLAVFMASLSEN